MVVDSVKGKDQQYHVIFLATVDGYIRKMVYLPQINQSCLIEEHKIVPNGDYKPVQNMRISKVSLKFFYYRELFDRVDVEEC